MKMTNRDITFLLWMIAVGGVLLSVFAVVAVVRAQEVVPMGVDLPITTIFRGDPGDLFPVATIPAESGLGCIAELESHNNESVHPNSDILVGPVTFTNVESATFQAAGLTFVSTGPINVAVRIGDDGVFSAGFTLEVTCSPPNEVTTTTTVSTSTTQPTAPPSDSTTSTTAATTTTTPPPVGGVDTGGGACADGSCSSLSPLQTWLWLALLLPAGGLLVWLYFRYVLRSPDEDGATYNAGADLDRPDWAD